jgi:hypothetical protein
MQMLDADERRGVIEEMGLQMLLAGNGQGSLIYTWIGRHGPRIETHSRPDIYALKVLDYCERYGWIEDPALLVRMLEKLDPGKTPFAARIPTVAARVRRERPDVAGFYRGRAVWDTCHLSLAMPFLGRDVTRIAFQDFFNPLAYGLQAARALVVNGPAGSGKTFTGDFLRLLVGLREDEHGVAEADFLVLTGEPLTPDRLAVHLALQMGVSRARAEAEVPRLEAQRPDRWPKDIAIWLVAEANRTGKTWHLLLDNFHLPGVPDTTAGLIGLLLAALAGQQPIGWDVLDPAMGPPLRLVLLGSSVEPAQRGSLVRVDDIQPVTVTDLETHFRRYFAYKDWPVNDAEIGQIVARYQPRLPALFTAGARWKMRELADVVLRDCESLERQRGNGDNGQEAGR